MKKYCEWCGEKQNSSEMIKIFYGETRYFCGWDCLAGHSHEIVIANDCKGSDKKEDCNLCTSFRYCYETKCTCDCHQSTHKKDYQNVENHNPKDLLSSDLNNHSLKAKSFGVKDKGSEEKE